MADRSVHIEEVVPSILQRLKQGDERAFQLLYERYSRLMFTNILKLVKSEAAAEDLLQDVFVKVWEHREHIDPDLSFKAYLFTISRHFAFNFKRRLQLEVATALRLSRDREEGVDSVGATFYVKETEALFDAALNKLPEQRRRIYKLCKLEGKSYRDVAQLLGISSSTVRDHMVKANKFIRDRVARDGDLSTILIAVWLVSGMS